MPKKKLDVPQQSWDLIIPALQKKLGGGSTLFRLGGSADHLSVDVIPTGLATLDLALGCGGLPQGRVVELYGREASGKSSLALLVVSQAQKLFPDRPVLYVDTEHALEPSWMEVIGVNPDSLWVAQPNYAEEAMDVIVTTASAGAPSLIVLDSVASCTPQAEFEGGMEDQQMGLLARLLGKMFRKVVGPLKKNRVTLLIINQIRSGIGPYAGEAVPGGNALKFFTTQILRMRKDSDIAVNGEVVGINALLEVKKNKVAPPFRSAILPLLFDRGFSRALCCLDAGVDAGIITNNGTWYSLGDQRIGQGRFNAAVGLEEAGLVDQVYQRLVHPEGDGEALAEAGEAPVGAAEVQPEEESVSNEG